MAYLSRRRSVWRAARAASTGAALVHPFDDLDVIAGQATLALELLEDVPTSRAWSCRWAAAAWRAGSGSRCAAPALTSSWLECRPRRARRTRTLRHEGSAADPAGAPDLAPGATIADGIAIKRPGALTLPLLRELLDGIETVSEEQIAGAMVFLAEHAKLVAEGAGAVAVATLLGGRSASDRGHDGGDRVRRQRRQRPAGRAVAAT